MSRKRGDQIEEIRYDGCRRALPMAEIAIPMPADEAVDNDEQCSEVAELRMEEVDQRAKKYKKGPLRYAPWVVYSEQCVEQDEHCAGEVDEYPTAQEVQTQMCEAATISNSTEIRRQMYETASTGDWEAAETLWQEDDLYETVITGDWELTEILEDRGSSRVKLTEGNMGLHVRRQMFEAATKGDWKAAETLLQENPDLGRAKLTEEGDMALHIAVSGKHTKFVDKLIDMVGEDVLMMYDGHGNTACHYAAMAGIDDIVCIMIAANPSVVHKQNKYGTTPFGLALSYGNTQVVQSSLLVTQSTLCLERQEWFHFLLAAITSKIFDVALKILKNNRNLAVLKGDDGRTALHVLAQLHISSECHDKSFRSLSFTLWRFMKNLLRSDQVAKLMKNPPILHDAAKVGNLCLIEMITRDYPDLLSHIDLDGYSVFHILVMHRNDDENILPLLYKARGVKNFNAISRDRGGNNFLHLAARSIRPKGLEIVGEQDVQMKKAFTWFEAVETVAPPFYKEMRNKDGYTPTELFWKEHEELLSKSQTHIKSTAESCMLISTIVLSLVFAAAFAPPGGLDQDTGIPTLLKKKWFASFIIFQVLALSSSTLSIIGFWSIISSNYEQHRFFVLSHYLRLSMCALLLSVLFVISAFLSSFFLVFVQERKVLVVSFMLPLYFAIVIGIFHQLFKVLRKIYKIMPGWGASSSDSNRLWRRVQHIRVAIFSFLSSSFRK